MPDFASILKSLLLGLRHIQITRYSQLASSSVIVFDHLITLDDEINLIWNSTWSLGKILFLMNRYYSLAAVVFNNYSFFSPTLTDSFCLRFFQWQGWTGLIGCMLAEGILQIRIFALYSLNKKILALMLVCFIASSATSAWIMGSALSSITATAFTIPGGKFCVPSNVPPHFYTFWIPMLGFETLLCALALVRGFQTFRSNGSLFHSGRQLVGILVRDSLMYFMVICATYLTCLLVWTLAPTTLLEVPVGFSVAMSCVLANRVVLNVREVSREVDASRVNTSQKPLNYTTFDASFCSPGTLTEFEMEQLRTMRARHLSEIVPMHYDPELPFIVL